MSRLSALAVCVTLVTLVGCSTGEAATPPAAVTLAGDSALLAAADKGRITGSVAAPLWLIEVSDFQCPWCKRWHDESFAAVKRDYVDTGKLRLAFMNFPLPMHANAVPASVAAMCASVQGKFWETHDRIFEAQAKWEKLPDPRAFLDSLAIAAGANAKAQRACSKDQLVKPIIEGDLERARAAKVQGTPNFFIGSLHVGTYLPLADFRKVLDSVIAANPKKK